MAFAVDIAGAAGSGLLGGAVGLLGRVATEALGVWKMREARKDRVLEFEQARKGWDHELLLIDKQRLADREETEDALKIREAALTELAQKGSWEGLVAAIADQTAAVSQAQPWVASALALVRPVLTLLLFTGLMICMAAASLKWIEPDMAKSTVATVVNTISFAANVALLFWFGERPAKQGA